MNYITNVIEGFFRIFKLKNFSNSGNVVFNLGRFRYVLAVSMLFRSVNGRTTSFRGFAWKRRRGKAMVMPSIESNPHIVMFGMSGQGKSSLLKQMMADIHAAGKPTIVFDAHNEHEAAVRALGGNVLNALDSGLNIFSLEGSSVGERVSELSALFRKVYSLGYVQAIKLGECMWYSYRKCGAMGRSDTQIAKTPSLNDVLREIGIFIKNSKSASERNSLIHMHGKLSSLALQPTSKESFDISALTSTLSSFSLAGLRSEEAQTIYINELLRRLYLNMKTHEKERGVSLYVIIDEAQFIINDSDLQVLRKLVEEGRKYGVGTIIATHMASRLPKEIIANSSTFITFYPREPQEVNYLASLLSSGLSERAEEIKKMLRRLRRNEAIVLSYAIREPSVISTPKANAESAPWQHACLVHPAPKKPIKVDASWAGSDSAVQHLEINGANNSEHWIMKSNPSLSIEHEVHVRKIFEELDSSGIKAVVVDNAYGPDLIAYDHGKKIALEYETGKKSLKSTAKMISRRAKEFDYVLVVVEEETYRFYSSYLDSGNVKVVAYGPGNVQKAVRGTSDQESVSLQNNNITAHDQVNRQ